jgi:hypothetical protein
MTFWAMAARLPTSPIAFLACEIGSPSMAKASAKTSHRRSRICGGTRPRQDSTSLSFRDLRLEGGYTNPVAFCGICIYYNGQYNSGYTNDGRLIGTWLGRAAQGELIRANYWLSPRKKIGVELRHRTLDPGYLPQGGSQNDVAVNADIFAGLGFRFQGNLQYERWQIPLLTSGSQSNVAASLQLSFWPAPRARP